MGVSWEKGERGTGPPALDTRVVRLRVESLEVEGTPADPQGGGDSERERERV